MSERWFVVQLISEHGPNFSHREQVLPYLQDSMFPVPLQLGKETVNFR